MKIKKIIFVASLLLASLAIFQLWQHRYRFLKFLPTKGDLKVLTYAPTQNDIPISVDGITVMFDRAMIPLTTLDKGSDQEIPLEITPSVEGSFHWLGTHGFIFRPKTPLTPATHYEITLPAGVPALDGYRLKEKLSWGFTTTQPRITSWGDGADNLLPKKGMMGIRFNMSMDPKDVEKKILFKNSSELLNTKRHFEWSDDNHILQVVFDEELPWNMSLVAELPAGALSNYGPLGTLESSSQTFTTPENTMKVESVKVVSNYQEEKKLTPTQETLVNAGDSICYQFSQPILKKSFEKAFHAETVTTAPYYYFNEYESFSSSQEPLEGYRSACVVFLEQYNQKYSFSVDVNAIQSLSGAPLKAVVETFRVRTDHASPQIYSNLTKNIVSYNGPMRLSFRGINLKSAQAKLYALKEKELYLESVRNTELETLSPSKDSLGKDIPNEVSLMIDAYHKLLLPLTPEKFEIDESRLHADYHQDIDIVSQPDQSTPLSVDLTHFLEGKPLPGVYLLELTGTPLLENQDSPTSVISMIQLTPTGIATKRDGKQLLVWTTDLETGQPRSVSVRVTAKTSRDDLILSQDMKTDAQGITVLNLPPPPNNEDYRKFCIEVTQTDSTAYSCDPEHTFQDYHYPLSRALNFFAYVYTDRPIYRPGQKVYFSSFIREVDESRYLRADPKTPCEVKITDAAGATIYQQSACTLGVAGIVSGSIDLPNQEDLPRGQYQISINVNKKQTFTRAFQVTSYRKPSFKVDVQSDQKEIVSHDLLKANVIGSYFFGAPLRKSKTQWSLMTSTYVFSPENFSDYSFIDTDLLQKKESHEGDDAELYSSEFEYDVLDSSHSQEDMSFFDDPTVPESSRRSPEKFFQENGKKIQKATELNPQGILAIEYKPDLQKYPSSQILTLEANVSDPSHQEVSSVEDFIVHKANFYLGIKPEKWVYGEKENAVFQTISLDTKGKSVAGKNFTATFIRRDYKYFQKRNSRGFWEMIFESQDTLLSTQTQKTDSNGHASLHFQIPSGGEYRVVLKAKDDKGNEIQSATEFSAWGTGYVPWRVDNAEAIEMMPDKASYKVGETAKILIKSLVPMTKALLTYERGHLMEYKVIDLDGKNAPHIEVPVTEGMIPNMYISLIAHAGRDTQRPPLLFHGTTELHVEPESKRLQVTLQADRPFEEPYRPGEDVKIHVETKDPRGQPQKSHVIISVADESVLKLLNYQLPDLIKKFYYPRNNNVSSTSSLLSLKAGDGGDGKTKKRRIFKDTAHFEANLTTDEKGQADFTFKLPDDLTTWVVEAVAITGSKTSAEYEILKQQIPAPRSTLALSDNNFVGSQRIKLLSTIPLVLRTAFPRFTVWGDEVHGDVIANNRSTHPIEGKLRLEIKGSAVLENNQKNFEIDFKIPAQTEKLFPTVLKIGPADGKISLSVSAFKDQETFDSLETSWPVLDRFEPEVVATSGLTATTENEAIQLPQETILVDRGGLDISFKASISMAVASSMKHLIYYPWGCSEQKSATLLALMMAQDLTQSLGDTYFEALAPLTPQEMADAKTSKSELLKQKALGILKELQTNYQNGDGGMKYWQGSYQSDVFASIQTFWALSLAKQLHYEVNANAYGRLKSFLTQQVQAEKHADFPDATAHALWVLSLDKEDANWPRWVADEMFQQRNKLSVSGLSYLLMAYRNKNASSEATLLSDRLTSLSNQQPRHTSWPQSTYFWSSAVKNTSLAATAFLELDPQNPLIARAMNFLFFRKQTKSSDYATQDDLALSWLAYRSSQLLKESATDFSAQALLNQKALMETTFDERNLLTAHSTKIPMSDLKQTLSLKNPADLQVSKNGSGALYYDLILKYYLPPINLPTKEEGLIISREYYALDDVQEKNPLTEFHVGENYKGHIVVIAPQELNYVLLQDKLPSGFEPVDLQLATTAKSLQLESTGDSPDNSASFYDDVVMPFDYGSNYYFNHQEIRDDSILWSNEVVPAGVYHIRYPIRATTSGTYLMPGATASEFYEPEIFARSRSHTIIIKK